MAAASQTPDPVAALRQERDRFVAFAFAASDLLLELADDLVIRAASGAAVALTGRTPDALKGLRITDLVAEADRPVLRHAFQAVPPMGRIDTIAVRLAGGRSRGGRAAVGACRLPSGSSSTAGGGSLYVSLSFLHAGLRATPDGPSDPETGLATAETLTELARAAASDGDANLTLVQFDNLGDVAATLDPTSRQRLMGEIGATLRARSLGGNTAGRLDETTFGLVTGANADPDRIAAEVTRAAAAVAPAALLTARTATVDLTLEGLSPDDADRALRHAVKRFCEDRGPFTLTTLAAGLTDAVADSARRIDGLRHVVEDGSFQIVFQPIVALGGDRFLHHHEALVRFGDGGSPFSTIAFGEETGLIEDLDLAVTARVIEAVRTSSTDRPVAINLSGRSIQSPRFLDALEALIRRAPPQRGRVMFEITESSAVTDLEQAGRFLKAMRAGGYPVCLDDFGAGAAAYNYLRQFETDYVKIDGAFLRAALTRPRDQALIRSLCLLCRDLGAATIGEMIETEDEARAAQRLGVDYGQGYLFGRPVPTLPAATPVRPGHRRGAVESWS